VNVLWGDTPDTVLNLKKNDTVVTAVDPHISNMEELQL